MFSDLKAAVSISKHTDWLRDRARSFFQSSPHIAALLGLVGLLCVGGLAAMLFLNGTEGARAPRRARHVRDLELPVRGVFQVAFSSDGKYLAASHGDLTLWKVSGWEFDGRIARRKGESICSFVFLPDDTIAMVNRVTASMRRWNLETKSAIPDLEIIDGDKGLRQLYLAPNGKTFASRDRTNVQLWDTSNYKRLGTLSRNRKATYRLGGGAICPDGESIAIGVGSAVGGKSGGEVEIWDLSSRELQRTFGEFRTGVCSVSADSSAIRLVACANTSEVSIWQWRTGALLQKLRTNIDDCACVAFAPTGEVLAVSGDNPDPRNFDSGVGALQFWDTSSWKLIQEITCRRSVNTVAFSPDGNLLASAGADTTVSIWDVSALTNNKQ